MTIMNGTAVCFLVITYRVLIVQARQSGMAACRPYVFLSGTLADTQPLYFGNEQLEFLFQVWIMSGASGLLID